MSLRGFTVLAAAIGLLSSVTMAQAQFFDYTATFSPDPIISSNQPGSQINVFNVSKQNLYAGGNGTEITLANFTTTSNALASNPAMVDVNYNVSLLLTKSNSQSTQDLQQPFTGHLFGSFSTTSSNLTNNFNQTPLTFNFGNGEIYSVVLDGWVSPGSSNQSLKGALTAHVLGPTTLQAADTPEPGTLAAFIGLGITGTFAALRRRRKAA